jgi:putative FmdB family regulatory protein
MPTYEYECAKCGHSFERFQNMTDDPLKNCPKCGGKVRRLIGTGAGIVFKGNGFYATDYGRSSSMGSRPSCGRDRPCCGRDVPCGKSTDCQE